MEHFPYPVPSYVVCITVPRPVNQYRLAQHGFQIDKPPKSAVIALIAIISHDKKRMGGNNDRSEIIPGLYACGEIIGIRVNPMIMVQQLMVDINFFIADLNDISGNADDPLDKILAGIFGKFKHHNIPAFRVCDVYEGGLQKWNLNPVYKFIDQDMVSDLERLFHGSRWNFKRLNDKGAYEQRQDNGDEDGFDIFSESALFLRWPGFVNLNRFCFLQSYVISFIKIIA